jgi:glyoxylase-like metal-dependent hydrolase (beta-lactamase superfamily II)/rhodanese-related sulfurtransferase
MVDTIPAERLAEWIDAGERFALVDTRTPESFEAWHVRGALNVPYDPDEGVDERRLAELEAAIDGRPVVVICGKGATSTAFGLELERRGHDVTVVSRGMRAWSELHDVVPVETGSDDLVVRQVQRRAKGCLGYVVGSESAGVAAVVDATRRTDRFKAAAADAGLAVEHALDTHVHADHVSGTPSLASDVGVPYYLGAAASDRGVAYEYEPLSDGDVLEVGDVAVEALHTPGHTSEMVNYLVDGELLLTGDTLFVDSVGRTELQFGTADAAHGAKLLYDSLHETVLELPDDTLVLPGHLAVTNDGHYEGGSPGEPVAARLGDLRERLELLSLDEAAFVDRLTESIPEKPPNYETIIAINTGRTTVDDDEAVELELGPNNCAA